jgi:LacI family transcriptional regulator
MSKSTINHVAQLAGVSIKTVSRVVNNEPNVHPRTRAKVEQAIEKLNYVPNQSARNLASHHAQMIGLVYEDPSIYQLPSAGYVLRLQEGTLRACRASHFELLIHPCNYHNPTVGEELKAVIQQVRPAGLVIAAPLSNMPKIVRAIAETGTPYVRLSPGSRSAKDFYLATNDREVSAEMTQHLVTLGHRRIAFITGHPDHRAVSLRFEGYKDGLAQSGIKFRPELVEAGDNSFLSGEESGYRLLQGKTPPTAIFAANDDMAAGVIRAADRLKIRIPDELSVAGCDDSALAQQVYPALTTIRQPISKMAEQAALALIDKSRNRQSAESSETRIIPSALKIRDSTGPAPG